MAAILGELEPPATDAKHEKLKKAAARSAWQGK